MNKGTRLMAYAEAQACLDDAIESMLRASRLLRAVDRVQEADRVQKGAEAVLQPIAEHCNQTVHSLWTERLEWRAEA
jgi:hypothetical protein